jgi:hypothetical protein
MTELRKYDKRYIIPNWQGTGAVQVYVYSDELGTWFDGINQCWRTQSWIDEKVAGKHKLVTPLDMINQEEHNEHD